MFRSFPKRSLQQIYNEIKGIRFNGSNSVEKLSMLILKNGPLIEQLSEKNLCLSLSILVRHEDDSGAIESLAKRILVTPELSLQGCNQILGAFAKQEKRSEFSIFFCNKIRKIFDEKFLKNCPNRELTNIFWASKVLNLEKADDLLEDANWGKMDCTDLALVCAGLLNSTNELWKTVRNELLNRQKFTQKDIPSILCSLACSGVNDRQLIGHLTKIITRDRLLTERNCPPIVWAISTCDYVHFGIMHAAVKKLRNVNLNNIDPMDARRVTRAFSIWGQLDQISFYVDSIQKGNNVSDSLLIWELVTNRMLGVAQKIFRQKSVSEWSAELETHTCKSQLYHMYLASLIEPDLLSETEKNFLSGLQVSFSSMTEDMLSSTLHRQASNALNELGFQHLSEYKEPVSGYIVDMYIPSLNVAIEVQGPAHYITDLETGKPRLKAPDNFKHFILKTVADMTIVQVTPWNFGPRLKGSPVLHMKTLMTNR